MNEFDPPADPGTVDRPGRDEHVGATLGGKYKLMEEVGEGGMGSVFMAQQTEPMKRAVAVKVIKAGMDSKAVLARFEAERQALAMMDHPNIAKVFDAGTTESGRPYFVMELVKGVPITRFCDERKLTPRQRLELFVPVCQAIQHAHQKGIIHRDIKPSNVLVTMSDDRPVAKVIDFGVAKATGQALTDKTLMTGLGAVVGTPEYMSPEQAGLNNQDIDTRSDVYALGVLLYELLTGHTPVDRRSLKQAAVLEVLRIVREVEAPRPSAKLSTIDTLPSVAANRGTEPAKLSQLMKGELDWVLLKALEKDRTRRYDTANGLARDVQRYLADEVVEARPPSTGYRLKKFVKRHKGQVVAAGLVLMALIAGVIGTTFGMWKAQESERSAVTAWREEQKQRGLADERLAQVTEEKKRAERSLRLALDSHADLVYDMHKNWNVPAKLRDEVANTLTGYSASLLPELESHALSTPGNTPFENEWAAYVEDLAGLISLSGRRQRSDELYALATRLREKLHRNDPANDDYTERLGRHYRNRGMSLVTGRADPAAIEWYDRAVAVLKQLADRSEPKAAIHATLLDAYRYRAEALLKVGWPREAVEQWDVVLRLTTGVSHLLFRHHRAIALAAAGDHRAATTEADALAKLAKGPDAVYLHGEVYSLASAAAATDKKLPEDERQKLADEYATTAVRLIRTAVERGHGADRLATDAHLDPVRNRDDFKKLVAEAEAKSPPRKDK